MFIRLATDGNEFESCLTYERKELRKQWQGATIPIRRKWVQIPRTLPKICDFQENFKGLVFCYRKFKLSSFRSYWTKLPNQFVFLGTRIRIEWKKNQSSESFVHFFELIFRSAILFKLILSRKSFFGFQISSRKKEAFSFRDRSRLFLTEMYHTITLLICLWANNKQ